MARKKRRTRRRPAVPPTQAEPRERPAGAAAAAPVVASPAAAEDLEGTYHYVRRDLTRIAVIAVVLFAAIVASQYLFL